MHDSDKHCCKLCGNETYETFAYPHTIPEVIPFKAYMEKTPTEGKWLDIDLRICPKCGSVFGKVNNEQR